MLGCRDWDVLSFAAATPSANALLDAEELARTGAILFLLARGGTDGRSAAGIEGFLGGGAVGFVSFASATGATLVFDAFVGEPTPKFHTLRTMDLAEDRIPKRGVALPLSIPSDPSVNRIATGERSEKEGRRRTAYSLRSNMARPSMPATPSLFLPHFEHLSRSRSLSLGLSLLRPRLLG